MREREQRERKDHENESANKKVFLKTVLVFSLSLSRLDVPFKTAVRFRFLRLWVIHSLEATFRVVRGRP